MGRPKIDSARRAVLALAPGCRVETVPQRIDAASAARLVVGAGVVLDCTDNFATRLALADAAWRAGVPLVSAAVLRMEGQLLAAVPASGGPCYRCLLPEVPPADAAPGAAQVGILGAVAGLFGALQAVEAVKVLLGLAPITPAACSSMTAWPGRSGPSVPPATPRAQRVGQGLARPPVYSPGAIQASHPGSHN